jgi:hypothetical protein
MRDVKKIRDVNPFLQAQIENFSAPMVPRAANHSSLIRSF